MCQILDLGSKPKAIGGMRCKLKRFVGRGLVAEPEPRRFTLVRRASGDSAQHP